MTDLKQIVAKNISTLRVKAHLTQVELGEKLSYSDKAVSRWERGEAVPDAYVLLTLSEIFGVTVDYILKEHAPEEEMPVAEVVDEPHGTVNKHLITLISFLSVWAVALTVFVITAILKNAFWLSFIYAIPISSIILLVLNSVWGNKKWNILFISAIVWGVLLAIHLSFLPIINLWMLYLVGIPAQVIIPIAFSVYRSGKKTPKNKKTEE